jgi:hypothetical protein
MYMLQIFLLALSVYLLFTRELRVTKTGVIRRPKTFVMSGVLFFYGLSAYIPLSHTLNIVWYVALIGIILLFLFLEEDSSHSAERVSK